MNNDQNENETRQEKAASKSRLGKEAKIGLAAIAGLLIVFAAVVVVRLTGLGLGEDLAAADPQPTPLAQGDGIPADSSEGTPNFFQDKKSKSVEGEKLPTVVPAEPMATKPTKLAAADPRLEKWEFPTEPGESQQVPGAGPSLGSPPPPFLVDSPKPSGDRQRRYTVEPPRAMDMSEAKPSADSQSGAMLMAPVNTPLGHQGQLPGGLDDKRGMDTSGIASTDARPSRPRYGKQPDIQPIPSAREVEKNESSATTASARERGLGTSVPSAVSTAKRRTHTVTEGETLFDIARSELGKASRWAEIYDLNTDALGKDLNHLTPGTQLNVPDGKKSDLLARPPGNVYRR